MTKITESWALDRMRKAATPDTLWNLHYISLGSPGSRLIHHYDSGENQDPYSLFIPL